MVANVIDYDFVGTCRMNELVTVPHAFQFNGDRIRVFDINGHRLAVAPDLCAVLGLTNTTKAVANLEDDDKLIIRRSDTITIIQGMWEQFAPQVQVVTLVTEDGATELILESRKPQARVFRKWLTHEVWPAIRDTGTYRASEKENILALPQTYAEALRALADEVDRKERAEAKVVELEPKAEFYDDLMNAQGTYSWQATADILGMGRTTLTRRLKDLQVIQANTLPYAPYLHHFEVYPRTRVHPRTGELIPYAVTEVRPSGLVFLRRKLNSESALALVK
jgi:prophage antirepressor-like protein